GSDCRAREAGDMQNVVSYATYTLQQRPELEDQIDRLSHEAWPEFMLHGNARHWGALFDTFSDFQMLLCNPSDTLIAVGHTVPLVWDGSLDDLPTDIDDIIVRALDARENQHTPNTFAALAAIVAKDQQGQGLSTALLREMKSLAAEFDCDTLIVPVRPTWKSRYPLTPMEQYARWTRPDGAPFDPWLRVHWRLGAEPLHVARNTLTVAGTVVEWEAWTNMPFPDSGRYIVPGALQPVTIDRERDIGSYEDPNVWVKHPVRLIGAGNRRPSGKS
ncbi:MAG: hypothetical protein ACE5Q3_18405, partial [Alphaproteobacteria bacterium]